MKYKIIPTVFATNRKDFYLKFAKLISAARDIQIDFMDGKFVKAKSISIKDVPNLCNYKNNFEAHLMINHPEDWIKKIKEKGFKKVIFHYEALGKKNKIMNLIDKIKSAKLKPIIALNPETNIHRVISYLPIVSGILLMGHKPGVEHMSIIPSIYNKIKSIRLHNRKILIQIDGGVTDKNIRKLASAGANIFNIGSFVADAKKPKEKFKKLKNKLRNT